MHCIPNSRMHGLNGYKEVIETVRWGLEKLGHKVSYSVNSANTKATNIIFGAHVLPIDFLTKLPSSSVVYNFEQMRGLPLDEMPPSIRLISEHFQIWEYSKSNLEMWEQLGVNDVKLVPIGYAPILTRIHKLKNQDQDIDVLIYGLSGDKRIDAFHRLSHAGIKVIFVSGLYGDARDMLIARSKIVLNINLYDFGQIFEIVRVSYLLANKKAVVATVDANTTVEEDMLNAVKFTTIENIVDVCAELLEHDRSRIELERAGFENFIKRDITTILLSALS